MSDDIVTRLRECWCANAFGDRNKVDPACDHDGVRAEAADEIERLRADRYRWLNIAFCTHCLPQHDHYCAEHSQDEDGNG